MEMAVVGAVVRAVMSNTVAKLSAVIDKRFSELSELDDDISYLKTELAIIAAKIDSQQKGQPSGLQHISMTEMRDLAFDIEDCLDQFLPCAACKGGAVSSGDLVDFVDEVNKLKKRLERAKQRADNADKGSPQAAAADVAGKSVGTESVSNQVGIEEPKKEILGLLDCEKLMVISIVGFGGSGKTALARAVFGCDEVKHKFGVRAWHVASKHKDGDELLVAILQDILPDETQLSVSQIQCQVLRLQQSIRTQLRLQQTRCLIAIDDIDIRHWEAIKSFFSELRMIRILLTTTVQTVANACTKDSGYIYNMRTLSEEDSKDLLKKKVCKFNAPSTDLADGSAAIVHKCHGHPLALISVANYLLQQDPLNGDVCQDTSRFLCTLMDQNKHGNFTKLRQVLVNNYSSLPGDLKTCLLYTSLFPNDRPVSRKTLTSRWLAEGYIGDQRERTDQEAADENFKELMDRNIIQPMDASNSGKAKTCKPHGIMHQFMRYKSISSNFIATSLEKRSNFRHLIIENRTNRRASSMDHGTGPAAHCRNTLKNLFTCFKPSTSGKELRPRSLTVFGSAEEAVYSDLINCKLLRVLDLKECNDYLSKRHRKYIYKLLHLKYLTLGSSVRKLENQIKHLHCLETLDLRKTKIETLPVEVISLPHLAHLFGKIKLKKVGSKNHKNFNLQTIAGVIVDSNSGFPELMEHMEKLTKVKIWCEITSTDRIYTILSGAIRKFAQAGMDTSRGARSLSLHLKDSSKDLLHHLQGVNPNVPLVFYLSSLKLHGRPTRFHEFAESVSGLKELCLSRTNLKGDELLAGLRELRCLVYLKLAEVHLEDLDINLVGDLASLQRLCLVVQESRFPKIAQGALPGLISLQLLCKDLVGLCDGIKVENFEDLREVALDSMVNRETTIKLWENEASKHPMRPKVVLLKRVEPDNISSDSVVKYVATDNGSSEPRVVQGTT